MSNFFVTVLSIAGIALAVGTLVGAVIFVPMLFYSLPYLCWAGWNAGSNGVPRKRDSEKLPPIKGLIFTVKNATKLYRSWITGKPHGITKI